MLKTLSLAAGFAVALGACPNSCSGHGYCDENHRCVCYRAPGTKGGLREAWTGADCSQRTCPLGRSFDVISDATQELLPVNFDAANKDVALYKSHPNSAPKLKAFLNNGFKLNRDLGLDVQVVSVDVNTDTIKFSWKTNTEKTFNKEETAVLDNSGTNSAYTTKQTAYHVKPKIGSDFVDSGLFLYWDVTTTDLDTATLKVHAGDFYYLNVTHNNGILFAQDDHNNAHGNIECSGRGVCDRALGSCKCVEGYTGDACQRVECPNDCSGHGTCQSQKTFLDEVGNVYKGFDAEGQMGCKCDDNFFGADCSYAACPSGADPLKGDGAAEGRECSGRGNCDYTTGSCNCFKGFYGERCESQSTQI